MDGAPGLGLKGSKVMGVGKSLGALRFAQNDGKNKDKNQGEMRGSIHCATDGEAVHRFGRDDDLLWGVFASVEMMGWVAGLERFALCANVPPMTKGLSWMGHPRFGAESSERYGCG
jgi:hypothetical protein